MSKARLRCVDQPAATTPKQPTPQLPVRRPLSAAAALAAENADGLRALDDLDEGVQTFRGGHEAEQDGKQ